MSIKTIELPTADGGTRGLLDWFTAHGIGDEEAFAFLKWMRSNNDPDTVGAAHEIVAGRLTGGVDDSETIVEVSSTLGYTWENRRNFTKLVRRGVQRIRDGEDDPDRPTR